MRLSRVSILAPLAPLVVAVLTALPAAQAQQATTPPASSADMPPGTVQDNAGSTAQNAPALPHRPQAQRGPSVRAWTLPGEKGARRTLAEPSEEPQTIHLRVAYSATPDFRKVRWETFPLKRRPGTGGYYEAVVPSPPTDAPFISAYAEATFVGAAGRVRVSSPKFTWNGKPLPGDARLRNTRTCPLHGSAKYVVPIYYGEGGETTKDYIAGGCLIYLDSPTWHCRLCDCDWGIVGKPCQGAPQAPSL